ncbi:MAG: polysaccharide pyruvyl transferase family protein [Candidatus Sedimenticola sp. (ex Thyasira tokunagai)]
MGKKKILVLNDGASYENWGIKACIDGLNNIFQNTFEDFEIIGRSHSYMHKKYSCEPRLLSKKIFNDHSRVAKKLFDEFHFLPRISDEFEYVAELWASGRGGKGAEDFICAVRDVDIVIFNGEGSTYRDNIGAIKGLFMLWYAKMKMNKMTYFLNGSVTLTSVDSILPAMVRRVFSVIDGIAVREPYSYKSVMNFYSELSSIRVIPDSVLSLNLGKSKENKLIDNLEFIEKSFFCFSLSMLPMDFRKTRERSSIVNLICELKKIVPNAVLLAKDIEDQVLRDVAKLTDSYFVGPEFSYQDISYILSKSRFLLSGRYHHLIFAAKVGCPVIPMASSSHKIHGLSALYENVMPAPVDPTDLWNETEKILKRAIDITSNDSLRAAYIESSEGLMNNVFEGASDMFKDFK